MRTSPADARWRAVATGLRTFAHWMGVSGALVVAGTVVLLAMPLSNVLGYEFAAGATALITVIGCYRRIARAPMRSPWHDAAAGCRDLAGLVAVIGGLGALAALRVANCDPVGGLHYLVVLTLGGVPWAVGVAVAMTWALPRHARAGAALMLGASAISTILFLALQPPIVAYSPLLGYYAGSIYDESLTGLAAHWVFRVFTTSAAIAWVALLAWAHDRRDRRSRTIALVAVLVAGCLWWWRGDLGLERNRAWIEASLGGRVESDHFIIHYEASRFDERSLRLLIADHEARWHELTDLLGVAPPERLVSFVYGSNTQRGERMGGYRTLVAKVWLGEMHITWSGVGSDLLAHEMAHLLLRHDGYGPLRLASREGIVPIMALVEGAATAAAWGATDLDEHAWSAALHELGLAESVASLLGPAGFWTRPSGRAYTLSGSFSRWLIDTEGADRYRAAYRRGGFEEVYGRSLATLESEWRAFLAAQPMDPRLLEQARYRYDRPSMFSRRCARHVATRLDETRALYRARRHDEASRCAEALVASDPGNLQLRLDLAAASFAAGDASVAARWARTVAEEPAAGRVQRLRAQEWLADVAWNEGRDADAATLYAALLEEAVAGSDLRRLRSKLEGVLAQDGAPLTSTALRRFFVARPAPAREAVLVELHEAWVRERRPVTAYLVGLALTESGSERVRELLGPEVRSHLDEERRWFALQSYATREATDGDRILACAAWNELAHAAPRGSSIAALARQWIGRCDASTLPIDLLPP